MQISNKSTILLNFKKKYTYYIYLHDYDSEYITYIDFIKKIALNSLIIIRDSSDVLENV